MADLAARRATVEEESTQLLADAKDVRKKADEYATSSRQKAQTEAEQIIEEAKTRAQELVDERREAAQEEIDGLNTRIAALQEREASITARVDELRSIFANAFGSNLFNTEAAPAAEQSEDKSEDAQSTDASESKAESSESVSDSE